jgi:hypothetical protein
LGRDLPPSANVPEAVSELIDRDLEPNEILDLSAFHRLVTLVGAGGIGKTRLGIEVARRLISRFGDGVWLVELASRLDLDLASDLDHLVVGQVEIVPHPGGVATHRGEQGLLPVWNTLPSS